MDDRLVIAAMISLIMVIVLVRLGLRYTQNKRQFRLRQMGRGKSSPSKMPS